MPFTSYTVTTRRRADCGARLGVLGAKRIADIGAGCMCMRTCIGRIQGCRPGTAARPGEQRD
jgi:hypothetical protein